MDSLIFALNAITPIVGLIAIGYLLKRWGWINQDFAKLTNKLVFHIFLPAMLFLNVYKIENLGEMDFTYILYVMAVVLLLFFGAIPIVMLLVKEPAERGVLLQSAFRSNYALVGIPLAESLFGEEGTMVATLLSAVVVPSINVLAVISLTVFRKGAEKPNVKKILLGIAQNPLIRAILFGLLVLGIRALFVKWNVDFRLNTIQPLFSVLGSLSNLATPLALLSLGAQFEFSAVAELKREITFGTLMRTVVAPILGIGTAYLLFADRFGGAHFAAFVAVFATPVAISSVPMAQEMGGDVRLAGQLVVFSTLFSALSIFLTAFLLRSVGIF